MSRRDGTNQTSWITPAQAAELTGIANARTFQRWAREDKIPHITTPNRRILFKQEDIEALLVPTAESAHRGEDGRSDVPNTDSLPGFEGFKP